MKHIFVSIVGYLLIVCSASAQTQINPIIGVNFSTLASVPDNVSSEARVGWHFGANFRFGDHFFLMPGIHYAQLNSELTAVEDAQNISDTSFKSNIGVLRIPIMAGLRIFSNENQDAMFNINIHTGIATEFVLSVDEENTGVSKEDFNSPLFAAVAGIGFDILFLTLDIDYELGLTSVFDNERIKLSTEPKNNALIISLGGKFRM